MWTTPKRLLPDEDCPVAAWDGHGLFVAKWTQASDGPAVLWWECSEYGDIHHSNAGPIMRDPDVWCHLPQRFVKLKRRA